MAIGAHTPVVPVILFNIAQMQEGGFELLFTDHIPTHFSKFSNELALMGDTYSILDA